MDDSSPSLRPGPGTSAADARLGVRANRTRSAILEASKRLFLERGYAGTRISNITDACGISRAGFYTYFKDKREIFAALGQATYDELLTVVAKWDDVARPTTTAELEEWIRRYFRFMDEHGAFSLSAQSGPDDDEVRAVSSRMQMRVAWLIGTALRSRQRVPTTAPEALGVAVQAMLDRTWYHCHSQRLPVAESDIVATIAALIMTVVEQGPADEG